MAKEIVRTISLPESGEVGFRFEGKGSSRSVGLRVSYDPERGYSVTINSLGQDERDKGGDLELKYFGKQG